MLGVLLRATRDSVLLIALLHSVFKPHQQRQRHRRRPSGRRRTRAGDADRRDRADRRDGDRHPAATDLGLPARRDHGRDLGHRTTATVPVPWCTT
jgi:hypothetical protein